MSAGSCALSQATKVLVCVVFLVAVISAAAQELPACNTPTIIASVVDPHGMPIVGLTAYNFRLSHRGDSGTVMSSEFRAESSVRVVILLDRSGSMFGRPFSNKQKVANAVASEFVSLAPEQMQVSLLSFASSIDERLQAANGRKPIQQWLASSPPSSQKRKDVQTAMYDAMFETLHEFGPAHPGDSIYVITDGGDNRSKAKFSQLEHALLRSGVRLYVFLLTDLTSMQGDQAGTFNLEGLARRSGGLLDGMQASGLMPVTADRFVYNDEVVRAIQNTTRQTLNQMSAFYVLSVLEEKPSVRPKDWNLEVVDSDGHKRKDIGLAYSDSPESCLQQVSQVK